MSDASYEPRVWLWGTLPFCSCVLVLLRVPSCCVMKAAAPVPLPPGAVTAEEWQPAGYLVFEGEERHIGESIRLWAHGIQHDDGRIDDGATEAPGISLVAIWCRSPYLEL